MHQKLPSARNFANSTARLAIEYRGKNGAHLFEISPAVAGTLLTLAALVTTLTIASGAYIFSKDEILRSVLSGQARMQYAYEDRISQLRAHIDRVAGRQLVDQDSVEAKLHELINRQVQLESRQALVARISDEAFKAGIAVHDSRTAPRPDLSTTGSVSAQMPNAFAPNAFAPMQSPSANPLAQPVPRAKPMPEETGLRPITSPDNAARPAAVPQRSTHIDRRTLPLLLEQVQASAAMMSSNQIAMLRGIEGKAQVSARRFRTMLDSTGLDQARFARIIPAGKDQRTSAMGGPLIPMTSAEAAQFEKSLNAAQTYLQETERLSRVVRNLPVRRPLPRGHETTSTFGARSDPFTRGLAMHSGLDFRATTGTPVKVTGDGKVVEADWVGGYGRMVEVDHGFGLKTRYAHLSAIDVSVGDTVRKGEVVGLVGSSGRSTGPHLHYEVRIDDEAVDPIAFVRAGERAAID